MGMIQINTGQHTSSEKNFQAIPPYVLDQVKWARKQAIEIAKKKASANVYFKAIAEGSRSLSELLADDNMWINYHPTMAGYGLTPGSTFATEFAIGTFAFRDGKQMVLATIIHELAHCNGAPGGDSKVAEEALIACGLGRASEKGGKDDPKTPYNPSVSG
jgi:hypothetical protein